MALHFSNDDDRSDGFLRTIARFIINGALVIALALFVVQYVCHSYSVTGHSMEPSFQVGDKVLVNRVNYKLVSPKRFDVILFTLGDSTQQTYMKRIVALPGETIKIRKGSIYINDEVLDTTGIIEDINLAGSAEHAITMGEDEYFVIGDNSGSSEDSRFSNIGNVKRDNIIGKVWIRISPIKHFGLVRGKK